jgi:conjugation system TraG family ATPase
MQRSTNYSYPILEYSPEGMLSTNGDFTACFELIKYLLFSLTLGQIESLHQAFVKAIRSLAFGTILHFQDLYIRMPWLPTHGTTAAPFLSQASDRHFEGREWIANLSYCFITLRASGRRSGTLLPAAIRRPEQLIAFLHQTRQFQRILEDSGLIKLRPLTLDEMASGAKPGVVQQYYQLDTNNEGVLRDIDFRNGLRIGDRSCQLFTLADAERLPDQCSPSVRYEPYSTPATVFPVSYGSLLGPLLDVNHIYNQYLFLDDPQKRLPELETQRRRLKSLSGQSRENAVSSEVIGQFLQEAASGQRQPVKAHYNVLIWSKNQEELQDMALKVRSAMNRMGVTPHEETVGAPVIWHSGVPGNAGVLPMYETFDTFVEQAACLLPLEANAQPSAKVPGMRFGDRQTGAPVQVDISDEPMRKHWISNRNKLVVGPSGSGKSFVMNHFIHTLYQLLAHILILDVGGSYKMLCELLGGRYYTYSEKEPICFNPFQLEEGEGLDTEKKESIKTLLLALWKKSDETFLRSEYVALSNALHEYYEFLMINPKVAACFNSWYEFLRDEYAPTLAGEKVKEKDFDMDNFLYVLRPYYKGGEYDFLLNAMDQPSLLHERLIIIDIDSIKDHPILFSVVTITAMESFISKMRKLKGVRKVIIIEEAWKAIAKEGMSEYLKYLFKTVRKFFGEAIVVTQDIEDIISSPVVKNAILNNADTKVLLDMSKFSGRFAQVQEPLALTADDKAKLLSVNKANNPAHKYKEVFIGYANGPSQVYRVEVSLEEYLTYTTEESEKVLVNKYGSVHGGIRKGVAALAADIRAGVVQLLLAVAFCMVFLLIPQGKANAQVLEIVGLVEAVAKKVIVAADIQVQRLQTQTIALQDAEKALENSMAGGLLDDITSWVQQQENLYGEYYEELWKVKSALSSYSKVVALIQRQAQLVKDEQQAWATVQHDPHFSVAELNIISSVYSRILGESERNVQQIATVINAFVTQMDDAGRLRIIDETDKEIDHNYQDLREFTQENILLSLQRTKDENDLLTIKALYNL